MTLKKLFLVLTTGFAILFVATPPVFAASGGRSCSAVYFSQPGLRHLEQMSQFRLMTYNVENLFLHRGKFQRTGAHEMVQVSSQRDKPQHQVQEIAGIIKEENADVIVLQEVEGQEALKILNHDYLADSYQPLLVEGNDRRGINIGFLVKSDLDLKVDLETHKDILWTDPVDNKEVPLFSRDLPALILSKAGSKTPVLIVLGNHAKSMRNRPGDPDSNIMRRAQFQGIADLIADYRKRFGDQVPIVLAGDFNTDVQRGSEVDPVRGILKDGFNLAQNPVTGKDRVTHTYHPDRGPTDAKQMDALMVNEALAQSILDIFVYRYKDAGGKVKPLPQSYDERAKNPSDHFPIVMDISTAPMLSQ